MITSLPLCAPPVPPLTGASRWAMPSLARRLAWSRAVAGGIELMSMTSAPLRIAAATLLPPNSTSSTAGPLDSMVMTMSASFTASAALGETLAPAAASVSALAGVRFHAVRENPAFKRLAPSARPSARCQERRCVRSCRSLLMFWPGRAEAPANFEPPRHKDTKFFSVLVPWCLGGSNFKLSRGWPACAGHDDLSGRMLGVPPNQPIPRGSAAAA